MTTASLPGGEIYYELEGSGAPTLVFVHGGYCTHADFTAQVDALTHDYTVLTLDLRGHGSSSGDAGEFTVYDAARDVNDLIDALGIGPAVLVGHSLGTRVVLQAAADAPDDTLGVVLVDGSRMRTVAVAADAPQLPAETYKGFMLQTFQSMLPESMPKEVRDHTIAMIAGLDADKVVAFGEAVNVWDIESFDPVLARIGGSIPVLAIQATSVDMEGTPMTVLTAGTTTTPFLDQLSARLSRLKVVVVPDRGHFLMFEDPQSVSDAVAAFAASLTAAK